MMTPISDVAICVLTLRTPTMVVSKRLILSKIVKTRISKIVFFDDLLNQD